VGLRKENAGIFYGHLEYFTVIGYILWPFGNVVVICIFSFILVYCVQKNLATLIVAKTDEKNQSLN
jgi:hypothetical protein